MNKNRIEGNWKQLKGSIQERWGKLTDDDLDKLDGKSTALAGKIQEAYGITQEEAAEQVEKFESEQSS